VAATITAAASNGKRFFIFAPDWWLMELLNEYLVQIYARVSAMSVHLEG
jgi:hypothetical protein